MLGGVRNDAIKIFTCSIEKTGFWFTVECGTDDVISRVIDEVMHYVINYAINHLTDDVTSAFQSGPEPPFFYYSPSLFQILV